VTAPASPRVVLVEPQNPANVGFVARVLANFALDDWRLVGGVGWHGTEAERTGAPARGTLEAVREAATITEAVEGATHLAGFTARSGRHRRAIDVRELAAEAATWGEDARPALLFGREDRGLEAEETEGCALLVRIPTRGLPSLNLSHAVAIALHEWFRGVPGPVAEETEPSPAWSDAAARRRLAEETIRELAAVEYPDRGEELEAALRRLAALPIETRDLRILNRIVRHARWRRES
jgi:tRNA/rRNA methyltransferase